MSELLASSKTKRSITDLLIQQVINHMRRRNKEYVIAGNNKTILSLNTREEQNDHEEADTLMIRGLMIVNEDFIGDKIILQCRY